MRNGNTWHTEEDLDLEGMLAQLPVKLPDERIGPHPVIAVFLGVGVFAAGSLLIPGFSSFVQKYGPVFLAIELGRFSWRFAKHYHLVVTAGLVAEHREERRSELIASTIFAVVVLPISLLMFLCSVIEHRAELFRAWESYFLYDCSCVANPGVLRKPAGSRAHRVAHFYTTTMIAVVVAFAFAWGTLNFTRWPHEWWLLTLPPVVVLLVPSVVVSVAIALTEKDRHE